MGLNAGEINVVSRIAPLRTLTLALALAVSAGSPGLARADQPMDRFERLIESGKTDVVMDQARKWLEKNEGDYRVEAVRALLDQATWLTLAEEPTIPGLAAYRAEFPESEHAEEARELEANLAWYAARRVGDEAAYREVLEGYAGTRAAGEAGREAAAVGLTEAMKARTSEALSRWLSRYPDADQDAAHRLLLEVVWEEAEAKDTARDWLDLRAAFPGHPRADEAREREAAAAFREAERTHEARIAVGARYGDTVAGRDAARGVLRDGVVTFVGAGTPPFERSGGRVVARLETDRRPLSTLKESPAGVIAVIYEPPTPIPGRLVLGFRANEAVPAAPTWVLDALPSEDGPERLVSAWADGLRLSVEGWPEESGVPLGLSLEKRDADAPEEGEAVEAAGWSWLPCTPAPEASRVGALLRSWQPCEPGWVSADDEAVWASRSEAWTTAGLPWGEAEPIFGDGCPVPPPAEVRPGLPTGPVAAVPVEPSEPAESDGDDDDSAEGDGDDDDSAETPTRLVEIHPPAAAWLGLATPQASASRDLDGDGQRDGLHLVAIDGTPALVVVDGAGLVTWIRRLPHPVTDPAPLFAAVSHRDCAYRLDSGAVPEWRNR